MAKEKAKEKDEEKTEVKKSSSKIVLIIVIILLILILAGGGLAAYFLLSNNNSEPAQAQNQQTTMAKKRHFNKNSDLTKIGPIYPLDQFIVNLLSSNGERFLKIKMDLELSGPELTAELDKKKPMIRDIIIRTLSSKTFQEISTNRGKEKLKDELVEKINNVLTDGYIKNIFLIEFVVQ